MLPLNTAGILFGAYTVLLHCVWDGWRKTETCTSEHGSTGLIERDQAEAQCRRHGLRAVVNPEFFEEVADVGLHRIVTD